MFVKTKGIITSSKGKQYRKKDPEMGKRDFKETPPPRPAPPPVPLMATPSMVEEIKAEIRRLLAPIESWAPPQAAPVKKEVAIATGPAKIEIDESIADVGIGVTPNLEKGSKSITTTSDQSDNLSSSKASLSKIKRKRRR